ncbi:MAG: transketolase [Bacteroidetes bacterium]|nr:transketolase [Bacteroidota bacterium]
MSETKKLEGIASQVRRDILRMTNHAKSGHPGGSLGCADYLTVLFFQQMKINPSHFDMNGINEDVFFLSNGHISPVFYSILARRGDFDIKELNTFRLLNTRLQGHPATEENLPGIRIASGSLGQGLSAAIGCALSKKLNNDDRYVYALTGDGELQEGQNWEALMFAAHHKVDNLIIAIDYNKKQIDGSTDDVISLLDLKSKLDAFGCQVIELNGNNIDEISNGLNIAKDYTAKGKPIVLLMHTIMGKGVDFMEDDHKWHGVVPNDEQLITALNQLEETLGDY